MTSIEPNDPECHQLEGYTDTIEGLPIELKRSFMLIRQLDEDSEKLMDMVETTAMSLKARSIPQKDRRQEMLHVREMLTELLRKGEEKFTLAKSNYDSIDRHCSRLDVDLTRFEDEQIIGPSRTVRAASTPVEEEEQPEKKRKKRGRKKKTDEEDIPQGEYLSQEDSKQHAEAAISLSNLPIDPNEPVYCYCRQVSFGEMVACDNDECEIEWFHLECVGLRAPPKGHWYCKNCAEELKIKQRKL
ncbi:hypothetical protein BCR43DRAFT_491769 [Syncephalastrum racemosum]|uniref:Chromatin modification-related protein n=1 Tax=Syncephalastrum racemosum TaxID=13706 RepID=A0A1X2HCF5_SYNRA|nr:hypothetical protein BCR43DRAFT_491769 [Syncephalastrum racemosum]